MSLRSSGSAPTGHSRQLRPPLLDYKSWHGGDFSNYHKGDGSQSCLLFKPFSIYALLGARREEGSSLNNM